MNAVDVHLLRARQALLNAEAVVPHPGADGLAAGAIALRARGEGAGDAVLLGHHQSPFSADAPVPDGAVAVLDWGVRELRRPGVLVDHHLPEAGPREDQVVVSSYGEHPEVPTAALMRRILPHAPAWLAAVGAAGDLGRAAFSLPECAGAPPAAARRLAGLVNAPWRCPDGPVRTALAVLVEHDDAADALLDPRVAELEEARRAWRSEFDRVLRVAPRIAGSVAVVRCSSRCHVEALVATTWARRLAPRIVLAANDGCLPGRVSFAARGGTSSLPARLRSALPDVTAELGRGQDGACGGVLDAADFALLVERLGATAGACAA